MTPWQSAGRLGTAHCDDVPNAEQAVLPAALKHAEYDAATAFALPQARVCLAEVRHASFSWSRVNPGSQPSCARQSAARPQYVFRNSSHCSGGDGAPPSLDPHASARSPNPNTTLPMVALDSKPRRQSTAPAWYFCRPLRHVSIGFQPYSRRGVPPCDARSRGYPTESQLSSERNDLWTFG
jgi:hypothetical protein